VTGGTPRGWSTNYVYDVITRKTKTIEHRCPPCFEAWRAQQATVQERTQPVVKVEKVEETKRVRKPRVARKTKANPLDEKQKKLF